MSPSPATGAAAKTCKSLFSGGLPLRLWFGFNSAGPGKAEQLTSNSGDDLRFAFAAGREFLVACTQTPLCLPGNIFDFLIETLLSFQQQASNPAFMLIGSGRFHHHAPQTSIAGFGNAATLDAVAAGVVTRDQTAVVHQLTGTLEAAQRAGFGRPLREVHVIVQPGHVLGRPLLLDVGRRLTSVSQQKLSQPLTRSLWILFGIFARPHYIAQCFGSRVGHPHCGQVVVAVTAGQFLGIAGPFSPDRPLW